MDPVESPFRMQGAWDAIASGLGHIQRQVEALEAAVVDNAGLVFDLSRSLVESACRAVLDDRGVAYSEDDDVPRLLRTASDCLPFLPAEATTETEARRSLVKTLSGLSTTIQGICELRNTYGFASHGSGTPRADLEATHGLLVAEAADAIVGFLYRMHTADRTPRLSPRAEFEANDAYNGWIDDQHELIAIFESTFHPCEVLFQIEPETYRIYQAEFLAATEAGEPADEPDPKYGPPDSAESGASPNEPEREDAR
jgi:hypothetical protein